MNVGIKTPKIALHTYHVFLLLFFSFHLFLRIGVFLGRGHHEILGLLVRDPTLPMLTFPDEAKISLDDVHPELGLFHGVQSVLQLAEVVVV